MLQLSQRKYRCSLLNFFNFERLQQWTTAEISNSRNDKKLSQSIQDIKLIEKRESQWEQVHKNHVSLTSKKLQSMRRAVTVTLAKWCLFSLHHSLIDLLLFHLRRQRVIVFQSSPRLFKNEQTTSITHSMQISEKLSSELVFLVVTKCLSELHLPIAQEKLLNDSMMMSLLDRTMTESHRLSEFISSLQKWTDYVNHTFNADQREALIRINLSRRGRMSQRAPSFYRSRETIQRQYDDVAARSYNDWITWVEVAIVLYDLTLDVSTHDLWSNSWSLKQLQQEE